MNLQPFEIKDNCRQHLTKYLIQAISILPNKNNSLILDVGCGTGVPTLALSSEFENVIFAVDNNEANYKCLKEKIETLNLSNRIIPIQKSVFEMDFTENIFDIVIAEGLLNVIGFETGLSIVDKYVKENGYFIIHDEYKNHEEKLKLIQKHNYMVINSFVLDENIWWNEYYKHIEYQLLKIDRNVVVTIFSNELNEIELYKKQSDLFRSIYYILKKNRLNKYATKNF